MSSTVLRATDPVVTTRCRGNGLEIKAGDLEETVVLDLAGLSIVGTGVGVGIEIDAGGSEGSFVVGGHDGERGEVVAFNVGLRARDPKAVRRVEALELKGNRREGLWLRTNGAMLIDVYAFRNGSDGLRIMGRGGRLVGVEADENGGSGLRTSASDLLIGVRAARNKLHGIALSGYRNDLGSSVVNENGGYGVILAGNGHGVDQVTARDNRLGGVTHRRSGVVP